jgi:hypothetical protein
MRSPDIRKQDGASLILVLVFISIFGLIIAGLLTEAGVSVRYTNTVSSHEEKVYAADAGVSFGIQQLRQNNELCPGAGQPSSATIPDINVNGRTVSVICSVTSGLTVGGLGFAAITTATGDNSLILSNAQPKTFSGSVYVSGGFTPGPGLKITKGNFWHHAGPYCTVGAAEPAGLTVVDKPPYNYYCTATVATPDPPHRPPSVIPTLTDPAPGALGTCKIFYPGRYTVPPALNTSPPSPGFQNGDNYFTSGVYYFDFTDPSAVLEVNGANVWGGQPTTYEKTQRTLKRVDGSIPACAQDNQVEVDASGTGVLFVFGTKSSMKVTSGNAEIFGRANSDPADTGQKNMSFVSVPSDWTGWHTNTLPSGVDNNGLLQRPVFDIKDGDRQSITMHGMVYAPKQDFGLTATHSVFAQTLNGIVASRIYLQSSGSAGNVAITTAMNFPDPRHVLITACSPAVLPGEPCAGASGERAVQSSAVVALGNDALKTVTVESWRTRGPVDPS